jgi:hypothetical protein
MRRKRAHRAFAEVLSLDPEGVIETGSVVLPSNRRRELD